jgi:hypothetical protein
VIALEPGASLRGLLVGHFGDNPLLEESETDFETYAALDMFKAVFAANSFHWLDPTDSYGRVADMLVEDGHVCLLWNYPVARSDVETRLNVTVFNDHPEFKASDTSRTVAHSGHWLPG